MARGKRAITASAGRNGPACIFLGTCWRRLSDGFTAPTLTELAGEMRSPLDHTEHERSKRKLSGTTRQAAA